MDAVSEMNGIDTMDTSYLGDFRVIDRSVIVWDASCWGLIARLG